MKIDELNQLVLAINPVMKEHGFSLYHQSDGVLIFHRLPSRGDRESVEKRLVSIIARFNIIIKFEWSETRVERLSINLLEANDLDRTAKSQIVRGEIGANIGGRTITYVPDSDNQEVYVTLPEEQTYTYIKCDVSEIPTDVKIYAHFRVWVDKIQQRIVDADSNP